MPSLTGRRVAILVAHEFEDIELLYPVMRLSEEGATVVVGTLPLATPAHFHTRPWHADKPITGRFGASSARPSIVSSSSSERPAADGSRRANASLEACARCAQLNASST